MKQLFCFIAFYLLLHTTLQAQFKNYTKSTAISINHDMAMVKLVPDWSGWMNGVNMPGLKARERHYTTGGTQILELELLSTEYAQGNFTITTCSGNQEMNGWKHLSFTPNVPQQIKFESTNPCNNTWEWYGSGYEILTAWTDWTSIDQNGMRARMRYNFTAQGEKFIELELSSAKTAKLECAVKVCQNDNFGKNGWRKIQLQKDKAQTFNFYIRDTCQNGWWWQYRNYVDNTPGFGNDVELNPVGD